MKKNKKIVLVTSLLFLSSLMASYLYFHTSFFSKVTGLYPCPFKKLTGYPCATCGFTRFVLYIGSGKILDAIYVSPLAFILFLYPAVLFFVNLALILRKSKEHFLWPGKIRPQTALALIIVLLALSWGYNLTIEIFF